MNYLNMPGFTLTLEIMTKLFDHLVLDSAPLLTGDLPQFLSNKFYTVPAVIEEIRDEASRARLSQLPFKLETRNPSPEAMAIVSRFARSTGDLSVLSATDLQVIALTVTLNLEKNPEGSKMRRDPSELPKEQTHEGAKEYFASLNKKKVDIESDEKKLKKKKKGKGGGVEVDSFDENPVDTLNEKINEQMNLDGDDDDSDGEWITPENIDSLKSTGIAEWSSDGVKIAKKTKKPSKAAAASIETCRIACITSDFAMQNVLLQMRLELYTPDGCRVKNVKNWLLRCHACFTTTRNMESRFCPKCGGPTLIRTSYMIDESGACHMFLRSDFQYNLRGTKFNLPKFKGGRQGASLILREDQKEFQRQKEHYNRIQAKIQKSEVEMGSLEAIDDRIAAVFGCGTVSQGNRRYDSYDGLSLPVVGFGRRNPNAIIKKTK
jgi:RNA-binding protein NOB1